METNLNTPVTSVELDVISKMIYNPILDNEQLFPVACQGCKLLDRFKEGMNSCHAIQPKYDLRFLPESKGTILVIVPSPGETEDKEGVPLAFYSGWSFLNSYLSALDNNWVVANATGCYAGKDKQGKKVEMKPTESKACQHEFLDELIKQVQPKVVVFLGVSSMKAILKEHAPKTLGKALGDPIKFPEIPYFIIGAEDPIMHITQRKDLKNVYMHLFQQADRLCNGDFHTETVNFELVTTTSRLLELSRSMQERICLDTEDDHDIKRTNLGKRKSIWHPNVKMILMQITERVDTFYEPLTLKNYVFVPEILTRSNIIALIKGRIMLAHNIKYDIQSLWALKQVNAFRYLKDYVCTFLQFVSMDQGKMGNSLKDRSRLHFNINAYETEAWRDIDACNKAIADSHALLLSLISAEEKKVKEAGKVEEQQKKADEKFCSAYFKWKEHNQKNQERAKEGKKLLKDKDKPERKEFDVVNLEQSASTLSRLKAEQLKLRPIDDANFGDITRDVLHYYGACDTHFGYKIQDEVLDQFFEEGKISPVCMELNHRNVFTFSHVERWGLPMDMSRHRILSGVIDEKVAAIREHLMQDPYIQEALSRTKEVVDLAIKGKLTYEFLRDEAIKPNKKKFLAQLLLVTGALNENSPQTKNSGKNGTAIQYKLNTEVLNEISGGEDDVDDVLKCKGWTHSSNKTQIQWVWYLMSRYRKLLDLQRKFLVSLGEYAVDNRLHPDFVLGRVEMGNTAKGTITGRVATTNPNLLNIKKDPALRWIFKAVLNGNLDNDLEGADRMARKLEVESKRAYFLECDFSSQEPVVSTVVTKCKVWKYVFEQGFDLYQVIANMVYSGSIDIMGECSTVKELLEKKYPREGEVRNDTKTSTLAILYGQSSFEFANRTGIDRGKVEFFYKTFEEKFPEIRAYKEGIENMVQSGAMCETLFGLKRSTFLQRTGDWKKDRSLFSRLCRQLGNFMIQQVGFGITAWKSFEICKYIVDNNLEESLQINNIVHDSLLFTIAYDDMERLEQPIHNILNDMSTLPFAFDIPLRHTMKVGPTMADLSKFAGSLEDWKKTV